MQRHLGTGQQPVQDASQMHIGPSGLCLVREEQQLQLNTLEPVNTLRHSATGSTGSGQHYPLSPSSSVGTPTATVSVVPVAAAAPDVEAPAAADHQQQQQQLVEHPSTKRNASWKFVNYCIIPLALPLLAAWWLLALLLAAAATFSIWPSLLLARRLYWACPFIPCIWAKLAREQGALAAWLLRLQFEGAHCVTVLGRLLSLPLRPHLPAFYILGFPKCGTTSLASYLRAHPGISGISGMPGHEAFGKESHFFGGMLGRGAASSATLYRSSFPTIMTRWWAEVVRGVPRWLCFDACPTYACLPYMAARAKALTPNAKLVVMVRDPAAGVFSAETMLRNMGVDLPWSLSTPLAHGTDAAGHSSDPRFQFPADADEFWQHLQRLGPEEPLPEDMPQRFYTHLHSYLMAGRFADRLQPWLDAFGPDNLLLVDYKQFVAQPEATVRQVLTFVGADISRYSFKQQAARMVGQYKGARMHPEVAGWLHANWFADSNAAIARMLAGGKPQPEAWP
ncbi:hypothetical protein OEZ85_002418 [Tetradesmus obliquus]|uniref:Sulfotransferase n=1 Tax=Tetradesmus obliquus TaxID=3088 RepID=A0ABY8TXI1_TETOB|nr:hypothetical protein OEZ85_002418 [Tetradesmus obliquus]